MKEPDSRFTFEKGECPFKLANANGFTLDRICQGNSCEIWAVDTQGKDLGCAIRVQVDTAKYLHLNQERSADALHEISKTLLQILGQLKTRK